MDAPSGMPDEAERAHCEEVVRKAAGGRYGVSWVFYLVLQERAAVRQALNTELEQVERKLSEVRANLAEIIYGKEWTAGFNAGAKELDGRRDKYRAAVRKLLEAVPASADLIDRGGWPDSAKELRVLANTVLELDE